MSTYCFRQLVKSLLLLLLINHSTYAAMQVVGVVKFSRGVVAAQQAGAELRLLGKGAEVFLADNIQTSEKSFVIVAFTDGGEITIRPESSFSITQYINKEENKQATFDLYKGGIRVSTGSIAEKSLGAYKIKTKLITVKAQQADYSVRLCQKDCAQENVNTDTHHKAIKMDTVVARIIKLHGKVIAKGLNKQIRHLSVGAPLYSSDRVISQADSFALFVFRDASRMTLQANSELDIQHYQYQKDSQQDQAIYNLITGGLRVLTGKIGKLNQHNYQVHTTVATIGIRGTGFDLFCQGVGCGNKNLEECTDSHSSGQKCGQQLSTVSAQMSGLHSYVWDSTITQKNETGIFELSAPQASYIASKNSQPQTYLIVPEIFKNNVSPRPDKVKVDEAHLFKAVTLKGTPVGVYVTVHKGHVQLVKKLTPLKKLEKLINLGRDEVAYINSQGEGVRLDQLQGFQIADPYLLTTSEQPKQLEIGVYSLLADSYQFDSRYVNLPATCIIE